MNEVAKKKVKAIVIVFLVSSIVIYVVLDRLKVFSTPSKPVIEQNKSSEKAVLSPTAIKVTEMMQQLDESLIRDYIEKLSSFGPHPTARRIPYKLSNRPIIGRFFDLPIEKVARYIYNEFESTGLEVRYHSWKQEPTLRNLLVSIYYKLLLSWYPPGWLVGDNIEATLPGTNESSDEIYVLVAHYDTRPNIVGANDDSSGVALLLAAAKLMSQYSFDHTVRFVAVSGEEEGLLGSHAYAEEAAKNKDNIAAVFNVDMIGNRGPGYRNTEVIMAVDNESWIVNYTENVNKRYPEFLNFTIIKENPMEEESDQKSFLKYGYDAVGIAEATQDYDWHRKSDIIKNMDLSYTTDVSRLVLATVAEMAWDVEYK